MQGYIDDCLREAAHDAVAFGNIVSVGTQQFRLEGCELESFVRRVISQLLSRGARVAKQSAVASGHDWDLNPQYQFGAEDEVIEQLIHDWKVIDDGYGFFAWFTFKLN